MATLGKSSITELELLTPLSIENGGTGYTSLVDLKSALGLDKVQNTAIYKRYLVINDDNWELASTYNTSTNVGPFYAPITAGTSGQILQSTGATPSWVDLNKITVGTANDLVHNNHADTAEFTFRQSGCPQDGTARVKKLKGNSVVWNQLWGGIHNVSVYGVTVSTDFSTGIITIDGTATASYSILGVINTGSVVNYLNSAYYYKRQTIIRGSVQSNSKVVCYGRNNFENNTNDSMYLINGPLSTFEYLRIELIEGDIFENYQIRIECFDLLKMFGSVEAIPPTEEDFLKLFPDSYYPYNPGEVKSLTATGIKSVGFNAWDEEWEVGGWERSGVNNIRFNNSKTDRIGSKNFIKVIPNTRYYFHCGKFKNIGTPFADVLGLTDEGNFVTYIPEGGYTGRETLYINVPKNVYYIAFNLYNNYGTTYKNDICINLSNTGYRDGEYQPYQDFVRELPINKIKDSEGNLLFPDGLCSAGNAYDEITEKKAIKRIGKVDLGMLNWTYSGGVFTNIFTNAKLVDGSTKCNLITAKYITTPYLKMNDDNISGNRYTYNNVLYNQLYIKDSSYTDAASLKESLQGVYLYYELATPIEVDLDPEVNMDYEVWDFGTEQMVSEGFSTPIKADIVYGFGAMDKIVNNTENIKKLQQDNNNLVNNYATKAYVDGLIGDINSILESIINS